MAEEFIYPAANEALLKRELLGTLTLLDYFIAKLKGIQNGLPDCGTVADLVAELEQLRARINDAGLKQG
jgi:hypothetical protein